MSALGSYHRPGILAEIARCVCGRAGELVTLELPTGKLRYLVRCTPCQLTTPEYSTSLDAKYRWKRVLKKTAP